MKPLTQDDVVTELRSRAERESTKHSRLVRKWLALAAIAVPAVLRAGAAGNVTCREASDEIFKIERESK